MGLLKCGKQIMRLSRSQQQVGFGRCLTSKTILHHHHHLRVFRANYNTVANPDGNNTNNESGSPSKPPLFSKDFFSNLYKKITSPYVPPNPNPVQLTVLNIWKLVGKIKSCPEENAVVDEIRRLYKDMISSLTDSSIVKVLHQLSRVGDSPLNPPQTHPVYLFDDLVDHFPAYIIPSIQDITADVVKKEYWHLLGRDTRVIVEPTMVRIVADVYDLRRHQIGVFVVGDLVVITGTSKDDHFSYRFDPILKRITKIPPLPFRHNKVTAFISRGLLNIEFQHSDESKVTKKPKIYEVKIGPN